MEVNSTAVRFEEAVVVNNIAEEVEFIRRQRCLCGRIFDGEKCLVAHTSEKNKHYDVFFVVCSECERKKNFVFSIDNFFSETISRENYANKYRQ